MTQQEFIHTVDRYVRAESAWNRTHTQCDKQLADTLFQQIKQEIRHQLNLSNVRYLGTEPSI